MRLAFVLPGLSNSGGIERVATLHANYFAAGGHDVEIVVFDDDRPPFFPLVAEVAVKDIRSTQPIGLLRRIGQVRSLRAHIKAWAPDVVISIFRNNLVLLATRGMGVPVVITEHMDPGLAWMGRGRRQLQRLLYGRAARLVSVSHGVDRQFAWLDPTRRTVIHNPVDVPDPAAAAPPLPDDRRYLLAVGRFVAQKGFDLLLHAFGRIAADHPDWDLCIVGGTPPPDYYALIRHYGLEDRVHFPGVVHNVSAYYRQADLYVLSSRHEAFPMVLVEAMAHALPAVAFACPSGPEEIIDHRRNGLLVPAEDVPAIARALSQAMGDNAWRENARRHALAVSRPFTLESVMPQWEALLEQVRSTPSPTGSAR